MSKMKSVEILSSIRTPDIQARDKNPAEARRDGPLAQAEPRMRMRRMRRTESLRALVRETQLSVNDLIYPIFVEEGLNDRIEVPSMPGIFRETEKSLATVAEETARAGIKALMLFGVSHRKDNIGSDSLKSDGLLARMLQTAKKVAPELTIIADSCFCEYTDHGHCGPLTPEGDVHNDATLENLGIQALIAAESGADIIAPSGMMDGAVAFIRRTLDENGHSNLPIMSYSSKFASSFYGPFREAAGCSLGKGNRKTYQMDPANGREALRESLQDEAEGADILMVKPGMPYLDVLARLRERTMLPLAAYQVSGEYAMIKHAALAGVIDEEAVMMESLLAFKRAGADMILSYFTPDAARVLSS